MQLQAARSTYKGLCPPSAVHQQAACKPVLRAHRRQRHQQHALQPQAFMDASQGIPSDGLVGRPVSPPLSAERTLEEAGKIAASANALVSLCRLHNLVPSAVLVLLGAWASTGRNPAVLTNPVVWLVALLSGGVSVASVVINDYFDLRLDTKNAPHKPLPSGAVAVDKALLLSSMIYVGILMVACLMEQTQLRLVLAFSAAITLAYTPVLKRMTIIKNATVALVIALAPIAGALAVGATPAGMLRILPSFVFTFGGVMFREILMDMNDQEGDRENGVYTLPVMLGKPRSLAVALGLVLSGVAVVAKGLAARGLGAAALPLAGLGLLTGWLCWMAYGVANSGYDEKVVGTAVDESLQPVGLGLIMLALCA